jgi:hypothetical protein
MAGKPGRKASIEAEQWKNFAMPLPKEMWRAWSRFALDHDTSLTAMVFEHVEKLLVEGGYLRVHVKKDPATGREIRSYESIEKKR